MSYEPFSIRYRPRVFGDVVGQDKIVTALRTKLEAKTLGRTILLSGPHGSGKTTLGRIIAMAVNCQNPQNGDPCLTCSSCKRMASGAANAHSGLIEMNAAGDRGIDMARNIIERVRFQSREKMRVIILDECHQLTSQAQAALLKTLEEPPARSMFILATTEPESLIPTIRSRCLPLKLKHVAVLDSAKLVYKVMKKEGVQVTKAHQEAAKKIAAAVNGHPRDALQLLERVIGSLDFDESDDDIDQLIESMSEEIMDISPEKLAFNYVDALVDNAASDAFQVTRRVSDRPDLFIGIAMDIVRHWGYAVSGAKKMMDPHWNRYVSKLQDNHEEVSTNDIYALFSAFFAAYGECKKYVYRPSDVLFRLTLKGLSIV